MVTCKYNFSIFGMNNVWREWQHEATSSSSANEELANPAQTALLATAHCVKLTVVGQSNDMIFAWKKDILKSQDLIPDFSGGSKTERVLISFRRWCLFCRLNYSKSKHSKWLLAKTILYKENLCLHIKQSRLTTILCSDFEQSRPF